MLHSIHPARVLHKSNYILILLQLLFKFIAPGYIFQPQSLRRRGCSEIRFFRQIISCSEKNRVLFVVMVYIY